MIIGWNRKILGIGVCALLMRSYSFSASETTDCTDTALYNQDEFVNIVLEEIGKTNPVPLLPYTMTIFTDKDLKTALRHHQQYCCQQRINETTCEGKLDGTHYFPSSPFLIDHLINVGMRKFNGIQEHCDTLGIDCTTRDNKVLLKERREESQKLAEETDGVPPSQLYELFKKYWGDVATFGKQDQQNQLANAYYTMCDEAIRIRKSVKFNQADGINQEDTRLIGCQKLIQKRYLEESAYVQSLMVDKGVQYLYENMRTYLQTYFVDTRMNAFVDKFGKLDACLNMVLKYVTRTSCCVN